jgi:hypothetical protein
MITWILDQHVDKVRNAITPFIESALKRNHIVYGLRDSIIPKSIDLTGIKVTGPTIVRGSHGFVNYVQSQLNTSPGGFTHPTNFQISSYMNILSDYCLNDTNYILDYSDFNNWRKTQDWFVKPLEDLKKFSGVVVKHNQTIADAHYEKYNKWLQPDDSLKISISPVKEIYTEYRIIVVNGKAITGSTYNMSEIAPNHILEFADNIDKIWKPNTVYAVDIAETSVGLKIVEYNQFGTSAIYVCNQDLIIDALEEYLG